MFENILAEARRRYTRPLFPAAEILESRALLSAQATLIGKLITDHSVLSVNSWFTQTFTFKNTGTTAWSNYRLALVGGDSMSALPSVAIPTTQPGQTVTLGVSLQAVMPNATGGTAKLAFWGIKDASGNQIAIGGTNPLNSSRFVTNSVWTAITVDPHTGPNLSSAGYNSTINPYVNLGNGGQCVAYVWGRVYEHLGLALRVSGGAGQPWVDALVGTKAGQFGMDKTPRADSIAVWTDGQGGGHVAYVDSVIGTGPSATVVITEANFSSYSSFAAENDPGSYPKSAQKTPIWGGGYDGQAKVMTLSQMQSRGAYSLMGYIHLR